MLGVTDNAALSCRVTGLCGHSRIQPTNQRTAFSSRLLLLPPYYSLSLFMVLSPVLRGYFSDYYYYLPASCSAFIGKACQMEFFFGSMLFFEKGLPTWLLTQLRQPCSILMLGLKPCSFPSVDRIWNCPKLQ